MKFLYNNFDIRFKLYDIIRVYNVIVYDKLNKDISFYHYKIGGDIKSNYYGLHSGIINIKNGVIKKVGYYLCKGTYISHTLISEKKWIRDYKMRIFK